MTGPRVTYQGELGAFGEEAVAQRWGPSAQAMPTRTFGDALNGVVTGSADCAVIPIWNTTIGQVEEAVAAIHAQSAHLAIADEVIVAVRYCLIALPGASLGSVRHVGSHPVALAQCRRFFLTHPELTAHLAYDTAGAARDLVRHFAAVETSDAVVSEPTWFRDIDQDSSRSLAVIASARAAQQYGLTVLLRDVQDNLSNATHFAVVHARDERRW